MVNVDEARRYFSELFPQIDIAHLALISEVRNASCPCLRVSFVCIDRDLILRPFGIFSRRIEFVCKKRGASGGALFPKAFQFITDLFRDFGFQMLECSSGTMEKEGWSAHANESTAPWTRN